MKILLGIYSLFITLYYIAFFTFQGDFVNGLYTTPYLLIAGLALLGAFIFDLRKGRAPEERRSRPYALMLLFMNIPMVTIAFFVPLINGNRNIGEILIYNIPLTIAMFLGLFITIPAIGFVFGLVTDAIAQKGQPKEVKHLKA